MFLGMKLFRAAIIIQQIIDLARLFMYQIENVTFFFNEKWNSNFT